MLNEQEQSNALDIAKQSVAHGLETGKPFNPDLSKYSEQLAQTKACFVTLKIKNNLRGCIGNLTASRELALDIAENAHAAAFRDPRFPALTDEEFKQVSFHISVLSDLLPLEVKNETELLGILKPGIDGLVLRDKEHRATFLPAVWQSLPQPEQFVNELKMKAGLNSNYWSDTIKFEYYHVQEFGDDQE